MPLLRFALYGLMAGIALFVAMMLLYLFLEKKLSNNPIQAIADYLLHKKEVENLTTELKKKQLELKKRESDLESRSEYLDNKYSDLESNYTTVKDQYHYYKQLIDDEVTNWKQLQSSANPRLGQEAVIDLVKRDATARNQPGYFKYLHNRRGALTDTQFVNYKELLQLLSEEFKGSELKTFALNMYRFMSKNGYNPFITSWMIMMSLRNI